MRSRGPFGGRAAAGAALAALLALQCSARSVRFDGERYRAADASWSIGAPPALGTRWRDAPLEGAVLGYRGLPGSEAADVALSMLHRCDRPLAAPRTLARHLLIGLEERTFVVDQARTVAGAEGWLQDVHARSGDASVHLRTVTRVGEGCITDWVLVAPGDRAAPVSDFDAWWGSFARDGGGGSG